MRPSKWFNTVCVSVMVLLASVGTGLAQPHRVPSDLKMARFADTGYILYAPGLGGHLWGWGTDRTAITYTPATGGIFVDTDSGVIYINTGTPSSPSWTEVVVEGTDIQLMDNDQLNLGDTSGGDQHIAFNGTYAVHGNAAGLWSNMPMAGQPGVASSTGQHTYEFFDDFVKPPTVSETPDAGNTWLLTVVDSGVDNSETWNLADDSPGGVWAIVTNDANDDSNSLQVNGESFKPAAGKHIWFECRFKIDDAGLAEYFIGLAEAVVGDGIDAPDDCIGFLNQNSGADETIKFVGDKATAQDLNDSAVALVDNTWTTVGFYVNGVTDVTAYIDGTEVGALALATANITVEALSPLISVRNGSAAVSTLSIDYVKIVQLR